MLYYIMLYHNHWTYCRSICSCCLGFYNCLILISELVYHKGICLNSSDCCLEPCFQRTYNEFFFRVILLVSLRLLIDAQFRLTLSFGAFLSEHLTVANRSIHFYRKIMSLWTTWICLIFHIFDFWLSLDLLSCYLWYVFRLSEFTSINRCHTVDEDIKEL